MKTNYLLLFLPLLFLNCSAQKRSYQRKVDSTVNIKQMPYFPRLSGDSLFWRITVDRKIIPYLIERVVDTTLTQAPVQYFGGNYRIGDVCLRAIEELIPDFRTIDLIEHSTQDVEENGYGIYWKYVRGGLQNRRELQRKIENWYKLNRSKLVWVKDDNLYPISEDENSIKKKIPSGGFYVIKK